MMRRYKEILRESGLNGRFVAELLGGMTYDSYRSMTRKGVKVIPKWVRAFVAGYELGKASCDCEKKSVDGKAV